MSPEVRHQGIISGARIALGHSVLWAAKRLGRPVKWTCERQEAFLSDYQGRDLVVSAELALDEQGNFLALRSSNLSNVGAHTLTYAPLTKGASIMSGVYRFRAAHVRARAVLSDTPATTPYRSAGRPEAMFVIERLIDLACLKHGFDRIEIRQRNLIPESALPYPNLFGLTYDGGAYGKAMSAALALAVVTNAIVDALREFGATHIELPATPERIWRAVHGDPKVQCNRSFVRW